MFFEYLFKSLSVITKLCDKDQFFLLFFGFPLNKIWCLIKFDGIDMWQDLFVFISSL